MRSSGALLRNLPITEVSQTNHTVTVDGVYAALGAAGTRFRIYAPPGVQRHGEQAGTLGDFVAAASSRCLFAGYRYESPLAGFDEWSWAPPPASPQMTVTSRQGGNNFAGQYYTLFRHYDPNLMRFTSPDPIASPFFNLFHYAGNNPAGAFDPDGLEGIEFSFDGYWGRAKRYFWDHDPEFKLSFDGYGKRADATLTGAAFMTVDAATFGLAYNDTDRQAMYSMYASQGLGSYYMAGGITGAATFTLATAIGTGGASTVTAGTGAGMFAVRTASMVRTASSVTMLGQAGYTGYQAGAAVGEVMNGGEWTANTTMKVAALGLTVGGAVAGRAMGALRAPKDVCFVEGTQVLAASGSGASAACAIENIQVGDWVWARNEHTGEEGFKPVVQLFRNQADTLVHLTYTSGAGCQPATLTGTNEHPFWSLTRQDWVAMGQLKPGEQLLLAGSTTATVTATRIEHLTQPVTVYNFEVADWHTYHVGTPETGWVFVHNKCDWQKYEEQVRALYAPTSPAARTFRSLDNGVRKTRIADAIANIKGARTAIDAKYSGAWTKSIHNPRSSVGGLPFGRLHRRELVGQARAYSGNFDRVIYHSNSREFISHYSRVFSRMGVKNIEFRFTPYVP